MQRLSSLALSAALTAALVGLFAIATAGLGHAEDASARVDLWVTPLSLNFGPVMLGEVSPPQTITLVNVGKQAIPGFSPRLPSDPQFQIVTTCTDGLAPDAVCTYTVQFVPVSEGLASAFSTTDTSVAVFEISLGGEGVAPTWSYDARLLDFGALPVGARSAPQAVSVRNVGRGPITDFDTPPSDSAFTAVNTCPATLAPGEECVYTIDFAPTEAGKAEGLFAPESTAGALAVELQAWASPPFRVSARALDFGKVISGAVSAPLSVTLENLTVVPLTGISYAGPDDDHFSAHFSVSSDCGATLAPGAQCTLEHTFAPTGSLTADGLATLTFGLEGLEITENVTVSLRGVGCDTETCPVAPVTVNPVALDMGTAAIGTQNPSALVTITNNSAFTATFTGSSVSDPQFLVSRTCGPALPPGDTCTATVRLRPFRAGAATATAVTTFELIDAADSVVMTETYTLGLQGFSIPGFTYSPRIINFPPTGVGDEAAPITVTIRSLGGTLAGFDGIRAPEPFTNTNTCTPGVPAFGSCVDVIGFSPETSSRYTITRGVGTALGLYELVMSGDGEDARLWATPTVLNFGTVSATVTSAPQQVNVVNVGLAPMTFAAPPEPVSAQYVLQSDCPEALAPGAGCTLTYRFKPTAAGSDDTEAVIDAGGSLRRIRLWGYADEAPIIDPPEHYIFLPSLRDD